MNGDAATNAGTNAGTNAAMQVGASASQEWANIVTAAVLGTDRRQLPAPLPGWEPMSASDDSAVQLLDRAAAVATARRAGVRPASPVPLMAPAPADTRPFCSPAATDALATLLAGEHDVLLPEWFALCAQSGWRPPVHLVPTLLARGRRHPGFDVVARAVIGPLAEWLAQAMPELGIARAPKPLPVGAEPFVPPRPLADSAAAVTAIVAMFIDRTATWAAIGQLRLVVAALEPQWLGALLTELNRVPFHASTEHSRVHLQHLAQLRAQIVRQGFGQQPDHHGRIPSSL